MCNKNIRLNCEKVSCFLPFVQPKSLQMRNILHIQPTPIVKSMDELFDSMIEYDFI
jgi:hypothetical protein